MSTIFHSSIDVSERLKVVRWLNREECEAALANVANEMLQATVVKALQARLRRLAKVVTTIRFEDHGQDFLEWDLDVNGKVIECRPFQASIWCGRLVMNNTELRKYSKVVLDGGNNIRDPLEKVTHFEGAQA